MDPILMFGSVSDRTDGHAFPMAPFFWLMHVAHVPTWFAQRLWLGSILFLGGMGVVVLLRNMAWRGPGRLVAALAYMCSPYVMNYLGSRSVILLAWAGLPWLIHFAARAVDVPGWADPARFAIVVALATGGNRAATLYMLVGPVLWWIFVVFAAHEIRWQVLGRALFRVTVIGTAVCAWLIVGSIYAPRLEISQALVRDPRGATMRATSPSEIIRGLGEWRSYLPNAGSALAWYRTPVMIVITCSLPALALCGYTMARFRNRLYFLVLTVAGLALSVGGGTDRRTEASARLFRAVTATTFGGVVAPSNRAVPLLSLGLAVGLGSFVRSIIVARPSSWWSSQIAAGALILAGVPALFAGRAMDGPLLLPDGVADYWHAAANAINAIPGDLNVLQLAADPTGQSLWGTSNEPIGASLVHSPFAARMSAATGQRATRDLVAALDDHIERGTLDPGAIAPLARLMSVGAIVVADDSADSADSADRMVAAHAIEILSAAQGISQLGRFGGAVGAGPGVSVFRVDAPMPRLRAVPQAAVAVFAGDGRALVDVANAGLVTGDEVLVAAGGLTSPGGTSGASQRSGAPEMPATAPVIVTDGNRLERRRLGDDVVSTGATETAGGALWGGARGEHLAVSDTNRAEATTHVELSGGLTIVSSGYGAVGRLIAADRPTLAFDGDPTTGWRAGRDGNPVGQRVSITLPAGIFADHLVLRQAVGEAAGRSVMKVHLEFDGLHAQDAALSGPETRVALTTTTFRTLTVEIAAVADPGAVADSGAAGVPGGRASGAGFTEIEIPGMEPITETVVMSDELTRLGERLIGHPVTIAMTRWRDATNPTADPERSIHRDIGLPLNGRFTIVGRARLTPRLGTAPVAVGTECRSDLLELNGQAVAVVLKHRPDNTYDVAGCAPIDVGRGVLHVVTTPGSVDGPEVTLDSIALRSEVAESPPAPSQADVATDAAQVTTNGSTSLKVKSPKASTPLWLVRAASASDAWTASVDGTRIGPEHVANGFASAWRLDVGDGREHRVEVRIPAQRRVSIAVITSTIAGVIALGLVRRRRRGPAANDTNQRPPAPRPLPSAVITLGALACFGIIGGTVPVVAAGVTALALEYRRASIVRWIGWVPAILLFGVGVSRAVWVVVAHQPSGLAWASATPWADMLCWCALAVAVPAALASGVRRTATT